MTEPQHTTAELLEQILTRIPPLVPLDRAIWSANDVAAYLRVTPRQVRERYALRPGFPRPFRLPSDGDKGALRWRAKDVISWAERLGRGA